MHTDPDIKGEFVSRKALIVPINPAGEIFIQDRRGHKKPDWGYFGGSIEGDETPVQAVIRESKEELTVDIVEADLRYLGATTAEWESGRAIRYMYLYPTNQTVFDVREGPGGYWVTFEEARNRFGDNSTIDEVAQRIREVLSKR